MWLFVYQCRFVCENVLRLLHVIKPCLCEIFRLILAWCEIVACVVVEWMCIKPQLLALTL